MAERFAWESGRCGKTKCWATGQRYAFRASFIVRKVKEGQVAACPNRVKQDSGGIRLASSVISELRPRG